MSSIDEKYHLVLYVDSVKPKSSGFIERLHQLCEKYLNNPYTLEVIDLRENPALTEQRRIVAVPTLDVITSESRQQRFVGDLSISEPFIIALGMYHDAEKMKRNAGEMGQQIIHLRNKLK
ncbi:MAG: circadian clock protein KaiB [Candidatus Thiodiazotropha lotti]|uniref:Circadian clock protein KaiB n=1 Tax=Candidatus Thiodiazotropha lotti TaxID=2792787 RepID=A0A9E4K615_9GAMM|nr:circadian clock protein KaiB [Candidatus Thiodiazotropha lotti]MCG7939089.1 circadian clock protein KaiB [Candidatus Thiodiazotropha lotti]MCW4203563.1 circadian clock protein KaiB [Candidatus Thiodiazotropha lotti]MCW4222730.1 circadian clock protein KaiB [Candidatus Thiodiazotropha lotti]